MLHEAVGEDGGGEARDEIEGEGSACGVGADALCLEIGREPRGDCIYEERLQPHDGRDGPCAGMAPEGWGAKEHGGGARRAAEGCEPESEDDGAEGGPREEGRLGEVREGRKRMRGECADRARKADDARVDPEERTCLRLVLRLDHDGHEDVEGGDAHADEKRAEKERGIARRRAHESAGGKHAEKDDDGAVESEAAGCVRGGEREEPEGRNRKGGRKAVFGGGEAELGGKAPCERAYGRDRTAHLERGGKNQGEHCNGLEMSHEGGGC